MSFADLSRRGWLLVLLGAIGFLFWCDLQRAQRADFVTATDAEERQLDASSLTGYSGGKRWLIVPEHNNRSYQWVAETQQMLAEQDWRVRRVAYENAPFGRPVYTASLYRWWLGLIAKAHRAWTGEGEPIGVAVERAALLANPVLHLVFLVAMTGFVARFWGPWAASFCAVATAALYPLAGAFLPAVPDDHAFAWMLGLGSVLPLVAALDGPDTRSTRLFIWAGILGGLGLWLNAAQQLTVCVSIFVGAALVILWPSRTSALPWQTWSLAGAATVLLGYLAEYFPAHLDFRLETNHPLYGVAWIGAGELLHQLQISRASRSEVSTWSRFTRVILSIVAALAVVALPIAMARSGQGGFFSVDEYSSRLTFLVNGPIAKNLLVWLARDGFSLPVICTLAPLAFVLRAGWLLLAKETPPARRRALLLALGATLTVFAYGCFRIRDLTTFQTIALTLVPVMFGPAASVLQRWREFVWPALGIIPGFLLITPAPFRADRVEFSLWEVQGLLERQVAHWLKDHAGQSDLVVLLPPDRTSSWCFHGGFKGIGTANAENREGLATTVRIATATSADEAYGLIVQRGINYLVLPSWDHDLDEFARWSLPNAEDAFVMALHHWALPSWLQAIPFRMPQVPGFESESVVILKVTDETNRVTGLSRLAEYFVESERLDPAKSIRETLRRYPTDLNALIALTAVNKALGDAAELAKTDEALLASVAAGADRSLAWDRRVSLAVALAQAGKNDLARTQIQRCLERSNEARIRSLTTNSLYRLLVLSKAFDLPWTDAKLRNTAANLLPKPLRERL